MADLIKFVDVTLCDGCRACMVACKNWNDLPAEPEPFRGTIQSHERLTANTWNIITYDETESKAEADKLEWLFRHKSCMHCNEAGCQKACPESAIYYTEFNTVNIDPDKCVGCGYCVQGCPFDVVKLATYQDENGKEYRKAQKCTMCIDRLEEGLRPACVTACHTNCLVYDEKEMVLAEAEERLAKVQGRFPNANIYNPPGINGVNTVYLLADKPNVYGLPENPKVALSQIIWKDYAHPIGKALLGATSMAVIGSMVARKFLNKGHDDHHGTNAIEEEKHE